MPVRNYEELKPFILARRLPLEPFLEWLKKTDYVLVIFGPPGTGKTHAMLELFARGRFQGRELPGYDIETALYACLLYTSDAAAADDAARRLGRLKEKRKGELGLIDISAHVKTLDSIAVAAAGGAARLLKLQRVILRKESGAVVTILKPCSDCRADVEWSIEAARKLSAQKYGIRYVEDEYEPSPGRALFQLFDYAMHVAGPRNGLKALEEALDDVSILVLRRYLKDFLGFPEVRFLDFTTANALALLRGAAYRIVEGWGRDKEEYDVETLFLDEFQDLSPLRLNWIPKLFPKARVVVIAGDDDQTVYDSLHGADPRVLIEIHDMIKRGEINGDVVVLNESKRLYEPVAVVAKALIETVQDRVPKEWRGKPEEGATARVYVKPLAEGLRMVVQNHLQHQAEFKDLRKSSFRQFVLTPTNMEVKVVVSVLLKAGIIPFGLKGVPRIIKHVIEAAKTACAAVKTEEDARKFGVEDLHTARVLYTAQELKDEGLAKAVWRGKTCEDFEALAELMEDVERRRDFSWLTRYITYVDTAYVAKGLEANTVFVINNTDSDAAVGHKRAKYVALTRSKGNVYILEDPALGQYRWIYELDEFMSPTTP